MKVIINSVFIDSSILIENQKGNFVNFLNDLFFDNSIVVCINDIVVSEFLYQFISLQTGKAPLTIKEKKQINKVIELYQEEEPLKNFEFIPSNKEIISMVPILMGKYNLRPNDAIIIATCIINNITTIASLNLDFVLPCKEEGITLLTPHK